MSEEQGLTLLRKLSEMTFISFPVKWKGCKWEEEPGGRVTLPFLCVFSDGFQNGFKGLLAHDSIVRMYRI